MSGVFGHYFTHCLDDFSSIVLIIAVLYALLSIIIGVIKGKKLAYGLLVIECGLLIMYMTLFSRSSGEVAGYYMLPFSSYTRIANGDRFLLPQVIMNVLIFVPVGFLLKGYFDSWDWKKVVFCGAMFSIAIELLQLVLLRGAAEVDDVIHNMLGCAIGVMIYMGLRSLRDLRSLSCGSQAQNLKKIN